MANLRKSRSKGSPKPPVEVLDSVRLEDVLEALRRHGREADEDVLRSAHAFSEEMHGDQVRRSGKPYVTHPTYVAYILAELGFDQTCAVVALLHDVLEDTLTTQEVLEERFGSEIADLVDGVTKIGRHSYVRRDEAQAETFRKLILASVRDIRVILVKLADRLHNMMTLEHMPQSSKERIAQETLEIYAPTAHRLGMSMVQGDLEDLAFFHLYPEQFAEIQSRIQQKTRLGKQSTEEISKGLGRILAQADIEVEISHRVKRYYSIFSKMRRQGIDPFPMRFGDHRVFRRDVAALAGIRLEVHEAKSAVESP